MMAVEAVNNHASVLPTAELRLVSVDGQCCDTEPSLRAFLSLTAVTFVEACGYAVEEAEAEGSVAAVSHASIISRAFYGMHAHWLRHNPLGAPYTTAPPPPRWAEQVRKVALYDSLAFFKRGTPIKWLTRLRRGTDVIPYGAGAHRTPA